MIHLKSTVMKSMLLKCLALFIITSLFVISAGAQSTNSPSKKENEMKTYLIERHIPGAGKLTTDELKAVSKGSCSVLKEMGKGIVWVHSYVTGDKVFCVYKAENEELIKEHGKKGGFPVNAITEIKTTISPATAE